MRLSPAVGAGEPAQPQSDIQLPQHPSRALLSAGEAVAAMGEFRPGYAPPWKDDIVVLRLPGRVESAFARALDMAISALLLLVFSPLMLLIALAIRFDSHGRAFVRRRRLGKDVRRFSIYKFRTTYGDARLRFPGLIHYDECEDELRRVRLRPEDDPRLTRLGRWLRKTSLDELPALINVLKGEMTLIGPRAELPEMFKYYERWQCVKWSVKPGLKGHAHVMGRDRLSFQEAVYWDVRLVLERSAAPSAGVLARRPWAAGKPPRT